MLIYKVTEEKVLQYESRNKYLVPNGSQNAIMIVMVFDKDRDKTWEDFPTRFVQFSQFDISYNIMLGAKNECYLPKELTPGEWKVSVFGINPDNPGKRMTSISSSLFVVPSYNKNGIAPSVPEDDVYAMMFKQIKEMATGIAEDSEAAREARKVCVEASEYCKQVQDAIGGQVEGIADEILEEIKKDVYTRDEVYNKGQINKEGEAQIVLSFEEIDAIIGD